MSFTINYVYEGKLYSMKYLVGKDVITFSLNSSTNTAYVKVPDEGESYEGETIDNAFFKFHDPLLPEDLVEMCPPLFSMIASKLCAPLLRGETVDPLIQMIDGSVVNIDRMFISVDGVKHYLPSTGSGWIDFSFKDLL